MSKPTNRIRSSGRVVRVAPDYLYIFSNTHGSVFAHSSSFRSSDDSLSANLTEIIHVDDMVNFVAVPQNGPNGCRWLATKFSKRTSNAGERNVDAAGGEEANSGGGQLTDVQSTDTNDYVEGVSGIILDLYERGGIIWSETHGRIYFPMAAAVSQYVEIHPLNELFYAGEPVLVDAIRQPCKNDCRYAAVRVQRANEPSIWDDTPTNVAYAPPMGGSSASSAGLVENAVTSDVGEVVRLCGQFGFIHSETLGSVYFTLTHVELNSADGGSDATDLREGDRVQFVPVSQAEKNGCRWRALHINKLPPDYFSELAELVESYNANGVAQSDILSCEVAAQTDQSLWNSFLVGQSRVRPKLKPPTADVACQTVTPAEMFLLKAVQRDETLKQIFKERFPHLMLYVEKTLF